MQLLLAKPNPRGVAPIAAPSPYETALCNTVYSYYLSARGPRVMLAHGQLDPAQLSYWKGDAPGGTSGLAPQRSTTQSERPSLSTATAFSAPHLCPSGSFPHGATLR